MKKEFSLSRGSAMINFTMKYCNTADSLLDSLGFKKILSAYINKIEQRDAPVYRYFIERANNDKELLISNLVKVFKLLVVLDVDDIKTYAYFFDEKDLFIELIEGVYSYWRKLERYAIVRNARKGEGLQNVSFVEASNNFSTLVISTYRKIEETVMGYKHRVYRQLNAGANAGVILNDTRWDCPEEYAFLKRVPFIESIILNPPFITYPKKNTRKGFFQEVGKNPLTDCLINEENWFCYPAKVGEFLAYVYFHKDFMSQGVSMCNLFELAKEEEYSNKKPDIIYVFGARDYSPEMKTVFHMDKENDIIVGYANYSEDIDYFGYMKKMILTLHNVKMIEAGNLPMHGAMVNITMKSGEVVNILIVGDSGAGKSESLEAFRILSEEYIKDMKIIFDDMGVLKLNGVSKPLGYGTETGAFVRMDDLDVGYAYKEIDRSIFMNPDKINARVIIPVATYAEITKGYPVDLLLYANNYENDENKLSFFENSSDAIKVFKAGARMAKGTTNEKGLVESYFANPFGPLQRMVQTDVLIDKFFDNFFKTGVKVGQIKTSLGIKGLEKEGPKKAAHELFEYIKSI